jgi:hypothetical protein
MGMYEMAMQATGVGHWGRENCGPPEPSSICQNLYTDCADLGLGNSPIDEPKTKQVRTGLLVRQERLTRNEMRSAVRVRSSALSGRLR